MYISKYNFGPTYIWNCWYGCYPKSEACKLCFIKHLNSFMDEFHPFSLKIPNGSVVVTCLQSDFFLEDADKLRPLAWETIKEHPELIFLIITKRIERAKDCLPDDWGDGWENVIICSTCETQKRADERIPLLLELPCKHKWISCCPLLEEIDLLDYLKTGEIEQVRVTGEKNIREKKARLCRYEWVKFLSEQCKSTDIRFQLLHCGSNFVLPDETTIFDRCSCYRSYLADQLDLDYYKPITFKLPETDITY